MFIPKKVVFSEKAFNYELGDEILKKVKELKIPYEINKTGRVTTKDEDVAKQYINDKMTLVVGVKGKAKFQTCKPSAHYQLPLFAGCQAMCEYCYLNTQMGKRPYVRVYADVDDILKMAKAYADERLPEVTIFEGAATSDPIPLEPYTHALAKSIEFFGSEPNTLFRFVTKFSDVDSLLDLKHNGHTTIRFSVNTNTIIKKYEHGTELFEKRLEAAVKVKNSGYKLGFIIAPVFLYENWKEEYGKLIDDLEKNFKGENIEFEVISHRFTSRAKNTILQIYPGTSLPMDEEERKYKHGQFGYGKFLYDKDKLKEMKDFFKERLEKAFGEGCIKYII